MALPRFFDLERTNNWIRLHQVVLSQIPLPTLPVPTEAEDFEEL